MSICPIYNIDIDAKNGSNVYENVALGVIGWQTCNKKRCISIVKATNLKRHKKWFPEQYKSDE